MDRRKFIGSMVVWICILFVADSVFAENPQEARKGTISVTGNASEDYPPDNAEIVLAIENTALAVSRATQDNKTITEKVIRKMKELINKDEGDTIKTASYSIQPLYEYDQPARKNKFIGYKVINQVAVQTKQINDVGRFIDGAVEEGANRVDNISFTLSDNREYCKRLLEKATERAASEAEVVARSLGTKIAGAKDASVSCSSEMPRPVYRFGIAREETVMAQSATPVEAGTIKLQASVSTVFYIDNK
ncbi:MAG: SIMPL domain-containing protein [Nitrospirae bacterium]|nr:SIMPL domain-containing protein [Nitrospirota bacterium]